jgi:hypothetical protein
MLGLLVFDWGRDQPPPPANSKTSLGLKGQFYVEVAIDCVDQRVSSDDFAVVSADLSVSADLLSVCNGGDRPIWGNSRQLVGDQTDSALSPVSSRWL